jgi:hypothetical protein
MKRGFAYVSPYYLGRGLPSPRLSYLPASPHRLTTTSSVRVLHVFTPEGDPRFKLLALLGSSWAR